MNMRSFGRRKKRREMALPESFVSNLRYVVVVLAARVLSFTLEHILDRHFMDRGVRVFLGKAQLKRRHVFLNFREGFVPITVAGDTRENQDIGDRFVGF